MKGLACHGRPFTPFPEPNLASRRKRRCGSNHWSIASPGGCRRLEHPDGDGTAERPGPGCHFFDSRGPRFGGAGAGYRCARPRRISRSSIEWGGCRVYWSGCGSPRDPHSPGVHARDATAISPATIAPGETGYSSNISRKAASVRRSVAPVTMPRRRTSRCLSRVRI
jgi:hypothetical protein